MLSVRPQVSVVLPVRNAAGTIGRALASLSAQSLRGWEAVVVDDGSQDGTSGLVQGAAEADQRIRVVRQEASGIAAALNAGLGEARGEFIARLDADDEALPGRLAIQLDYLCRHPEVGVVSSRVRFGGDRVASAGYAGHVDWLNSVFTPDEIALNRFIESPMAHPSVMFRRELVTRHGGYRDGGFPEDFELWLRWFEAGVRMAKVPEELLIWHDSPGRLSRTDSRYDPREFFRVKAEYLARHLVGIGQREVWIWGAGRPTRKRAAHLEAHGLRIIGYIDVDARKTGQAIAGVPVVAPEALPGPGMIFVLGYVSSRGARDLIRGELARRGYDEGRHFLMCA